MAGDLLAFPGAGSLWDGTSWCTIHLYLPPVFQRAPLGIRRCRHDRWGWSPANFFLSDAAFSQTSHPGCFPVLIRMALEQQSGTIHFPEPCRRFLFTPASFYCGNRAGELPIPRHVGNGHDHGSYLASDPSTDRFIYFHTTVLRRKHRTDRPTLRVRVAAAAGSIPGADCCSAGWHRTGSRRRTRCSPQPGVSG